MEHKELSEHENTLCDILGMENSPYTYAQTQRTYIIPRVNPKINCTDKSGVDQSWLSNCKQLMTLAGGRAIIQWRGYLTCMWPT